MSDEIIVPRFLTVHTAQDAIYVVLRAVDVLKGGGRIEEENFHIVVLVPAMIEDKYPLHEIRPHLLCEKSVGDRNKWEHKFDEIARCKALQLWHGRNNGDKDVMPHLLFPGDTPYWGGVKREGIVVACSGFKSHFDRMVSGIIADTCIALAYENWMESQEKEKGLDFVS